MSKQQHPTLKLTCSTDELASPEIHTGLVETEKTACPPSKETISVTYDNLAVPELHLPSE